MEAAVKQHARDPFKQEIWDELAAQLHYVSTDFADAGGEDKVHDLLGKLDEERELGGNRVFYLAVPPPAFPTIVDALGKRRDDRGWTRLVVEKPFGHDLESAQQLTAKLRRVLPRGRDLPDRPLPRQGDRPEHARAPVRERDLRADLEPPVRRPRPDHRRRVDRDRGARRLLRARGRDPRHLPEPPPAAARAHRDGAADRLHLRLGAQREGEGAARAAHAGAEVGRARPVRARLRRGRGGRRVPRGGGRRGRLDDRDVRRGEALRRQLALGGHAVLRADGQAARAARDDDRDPVQARSAPAVRGDRRRRGCARTCSSSTCSRTRASRSRSARRCRARG